MMSYLFAVITMLLISFEIAVSENVCPPLCECNIHEHNRFLINCNGATTINSDGFISISNNENNSPCDKKLEVSASYLSASTLYIDCFDVIVAQNISSMSKNLTQVSVIKSRLTYFPLNLLNNSKNLRFLNLSGNSINEIHMPHYFSFNYLEVLDLSNNKISEVFFEIGTLPNLKSLYLQGNDVSELSGVENLYSLKLLDISYNPIKSISPSFSLLPNVQSLIFQSVPSIVKKNDVCTSTSICRTLPQSVNLINLANNSLLQVPSCDGILAGLWNLKRLYLDNNKISILGNETFQTYCFSNLSLISLANNGLIEIAPYSFMNMHHLQTLTLADNYLQHIPLSILQQFHRQQKSLKNLIYGSDKTGLVLEKNKWSCDCFQKDLRNWLIKKKSNISIPCHIPKRFQGQELKDLSKSDLQCTVTVISDVYNVTALEYDSAKLGCQSIGIPKPIITWYTQKGEEISITSISKSISQQKVYQLSSFGKVLTVQRVQLDKTGMYRCVADNSYSSANKTIALSVILSNTGTIIYIVVACVAFMVAIVFNSINMCMYMHEHFQAKRLYRKAIQEQKNEMQENPPLKARSKTLDESIASLNANRHYGKYDFTCQQMFLDTVIKGAHSVKKTLYDARHSEFSTNVWGYAAHLRDRLHIEMPSSMQLPSLNMPSLSMPSISMPTISMPSIPTMQDINTNIEKLGSSVMTRSHNLATSVGSVFTLKRWNWQQSTSSDNESRDSDEHLESGMSRVKVDVHETPGVASTSASSRFYGLFTNRSDYDGAGERKSSKSLPAQCRQHQVKTLCDENNAKEESIEEKTVRFHGDVSGKGDNPIPTSSVYVRPSIAIDGSTLNTISEAVDKSCHSYETSV